MEYETIIGLEVHAQLLTKSKMYCRCSADYAAAPPNTHVCPVCMGMPGVLPTLNQQAIEYVMMTALALNCSISEHSKFDRKNYPYPDLMKGYQISQFDMPIGLKGWLNIEVDGVKKKAGITRVHLEEDVAKMIHHNTGLGESRSLVDINRAGTPLMEIVGEPDLRTAEEARQYLIKLRSILQYLGVSTGNMEEGSFRCDANISIRPVGSSEFGPKVEVKNMNSFRAVFRALEYESKRQRQLAEAEQKPVQETRGWIEEDGGKTVSQRSKEYAHDYRYFPEPDLPPLFIQQQWVDKVKTLLPELPEARRDRFRCHYGLPLYMPIC
jgi:aspartyl-tRNA(Asn)/glutamyl-tRNA(Gln) amidotransferase subunit B